MKILMSGKVRNKGDDRPKRRMRMGVKVRRMWVQMSGRLAETVKSGGKSVKVGHTFIVNTGVPYILKPGPKSTKLGK